MGPWDLHDKFLTTLAAGVGAPDVVQLVSRRFDMFLDTGELVDITDKVAHLSSNYEEGVWEPTVRDGRVYGLPSDIGPGVIWYRQDVFDEHGIPTPVETWDDFIEAGKKITSGDRYAMPIFIPSGQWGVASFVQYLASRGGNLYNSDGSLITDNELLADTLQWYHDLVFEHEIAYPVEFYSPTFWALLDAGRIVTLPANTSEGRNIERYAASQEGKWNVMPWPKWSEDAPAQTGLWGGNVFTIPKQSQKQEAALTFIKWLCASERGQVAYFTSVGGMPAYIPALEEPELQQEEAFFNNSVVADNLLPIPTFYWYDEAETSVILGNEIDALFENQITVEEAVENFMRNVQRRLER
jgi:ABC-type glycerol-3-phosphate transport system substrate-binding protein